MKKICILAAVALCVALTGCTAPHLSAEFEVGSDVIPLPDPTPQPTLQVEETPSPLPVSQSVGQVTYRPEAAPSAWMDSENFSTALYALLVESIRTGSEEASLGTLEVTQEQFEGVRTFLISRNPWGTLTDITRSEEGEIKITYSTDDTQQRVEEAQRFDQAVTSVLQNLVPPESTQLSASVALYKYVAQTIEEDYEAEDGGLYSALVEGKGVNQTYALTYSFLLDQIGVENTVVFSEDGAHAWNVLTMDGRSFHCDPQVEAGLNGGQALTCFGLSDASMAQKNGWNTWASENSTLLTCDSDILTGVQAAPFADVDAAGNAIYFSQMDGRNSVFRYDLSNAEVLEVVQVEPASLAVLGSGVYYLDNADSMLYCYDTQSGNVRQALEGVPLRSMRREGSQLLYVTQQDEEGTENVISLE